jgi:hypothetical protein
MMSSATDRNIAHLKAFTDYARHCEDLAINTGHTTTDPDARRAAIADGMYWHHLAALIDEAVGQ